VSAATFGRSACDPKRTLSASGCQATHPSHAPVRHRPINQRAMTRNHVIDAAGGGDPRQQVLSKTVSRSGADNADVSLVW
jgi:hypothetical protein